MIYVIHWFVNILTFGLVSIATITTTTYHVDEPISELNDLTLNEVFDTNNSQTLDNFTANVNSSYIKYDDYYEITSNGNGTYYAWQDASFPFQNANYYFSSRVSSDDNIDLALGFRFGNTLRSFDAYNLDNHEIFRYSGITSGTASSFYMRYLSYDLNTSFRVYDIYFINLTDLGIDNLTQAELDDWFDIYQQAIANNGVYIESSSHLNNNIHLVDVSVMVISFAFWLWLYKFLKGVVL